MALFVVQCQMSMKNVPTMTHEMMVLTEMMMMSLTMMKTNVLVAVPTKDRMTAIEPAISVRVSTSAELV